MVRLPAKTRCGSSFDPVCAEARERVLAALRRERSLSAARELSAAPAR